MYYAIAPSICGNWRLASGTSDNVADRAMITPRSSARMKDGKRQCTLSDDVMNEEVCRVTSP
ncbi:hypothetical protein ZHAS_00009045 [Anopheles sinensis]|uniref:Uncharacterized protein n=1 Tax=Anopheles sinensis TaxID=74873 RepID=A0A084VU02_ANOSI|nr:hypothetical protein ZHAS_00009045 [Anopheles sinensis]